MNPPPNPPGVIVISPSGVVYEILTSREEAQRRAAALLCWLWPVYIQGLAPQPAEVAAR